jgi:peptidoglycan hydrolase-like protein with peptidoglycan-binding domain
VIGSATRKAIRDFQTSQGMKADGQVSELLVEKMREVATEKGLARPMAAP